MKRNRGRKENAKDAKQRGAKKLSADRWTSITLGRGGTSACSAGGKGFFFGPQKDGEETTEERKSCSKEKHRPKRRERGDFTILNRNIPRGKGEKKGRVTKEKGRRRGNPLEERPI